MSQESLARSVHLDRGSIYLYEKGKGNPQFKVVAEIAARLKADFAVLGCRIAASELMEPPKAVAEQLELEFDRDHTFLASVTIKPTKKSLTITAHSDYGVKSA